MKKHLSDNRNVPVYFFERFLPKARAVLDQNDIAQSEYNGCLIYRNAHRQRMAQVCVYNRCIDIRIYYINPYPAGFFENIDWNDSEYIEITKRADKISLLEIGSMLHSWGYDLTKSTL